MSEITKRRSLLHRLPIIKSLISEWQNWCSERSTPCYRHVGKAEAHPDLLPYPIDMSPLLALPFGTLDETGVLYNAPAGDISVAYHPTNIAQYALAQWNAYLIDGSHEHKEAFLIQARWLLTDESRLSDDAGCWPIPFPQPFYHVYRPWL